MTATERIILCGGPNTVPVPDGAAVLRLNLWETAGPTNVWLKIADLNKKFWRNVPPKFENLMEIAAYVYSCDASTRRGQDDVDTFGSNWRRRLHFHIPVRVPEFWNLPEVQAALRETLEFLSDDYYDFTFHGVTGVPVVQQFFKLDSVDAHATRPDRVALFSGGLDSLAGAVEEACGERRNLLLVNHRSTGKFSRRYETLMSELVKRAHPVAGQRHVLINRRRALVT